MTKTLIDWVVKLALPSWDHYGFDRSSGRFNERLDQQARPLAVPHRAMVQARQIYVYAYAARLDLYPQGLAMAQAAWENLVRDFCYDNGDEASFAFSIDPNSGCIISAERDSYTHAFVIFAAAHLYMVTRDTELLNLAERVTRFMDRAMVDADHGGVFDSASTPAVSKRQNPQMHLLEAYLALEEAAPDGGFLPRADAIVSLFTDRMTDHRRDVLFEHFSTDWSAHPDPKRAGLFEPGHHYEWAWLLDRHRGLTGRDEREWSDRLYRSARRHGHAPNGLIFDEVNADGSVRKLDHRLWPHTEAIKAAVVRHAEGDPSAIVFARRMEAALAQHFLDKPFPGGWVDHLTSNLTPAVGHVPASSLYHLTFAAAEANAAFGGSHPDCAMPITHA